MNRLKVHIQARRPLESLWDSDYTGLLVEPPLRLLAVYSPVVHLRRFDAVTGHPLEAYPESRRNGNGNGT